MSVEDDKKPPIASSIAILTTNHSFDQGIGHLPGAILERMKPITLAPMGRETLGKIADVIIAKSDLPPLLQEGLRGIVQEELDAFPIAEQGARGFHSLIQKHLDKPLTQEWREKMLSMTPAGQVVTSLTKGTSRKVAAPRTAHFRKGGRKP